MGTRIKLEEKIVIFMAEYAAYLINRLECAREMSRKTSNSLGHRVWREALVEGTSEEQAGKAQPEMGVWSVRWREGDERRGLGGYQRRFAD